MIHIDPLSDILHLFCVGQTVHHSCGICADRFSLSVALLLHKIQCHSWNSNGKIENFNTFLADLIKAETKHSSDEDFNYTFVITTSVTQIAKECIVKAEPLAEIAPDDNVDLIEMEIFDPFLVQPEDDQPSQRVDVLPNRTLCPLCGEVKSSRNMRRHMKLIHNVDIDPELEASIKARMKQSKNQLINNDEQVELLPGDSETYDPLSATDFVLSEEANTTNVEPKEILSSSFAALMKTEQIETIPLKTTTYTEENPLKCHLCNKVLRSSLSRHMQLVHESQPVPDAVIVSPHKPTHDRCPLCERFITSNNLSRHLYGVHNKSKAEIKEIRMNIRYKCLICKKFVSNRLIKQHFNEAHNIYDDHEVNRGIGSSETIDQRKEVQSSSEPTESSDINNPMDQFYAQCTLCSKTILRISLKRHFQSTHKLDESDAMKNLLLIANQKCQAPVVLSKCTICNYSGTVQGLNIHYTREHGSENAETESQIKQFESQCPLCKKIMNRNNLKRHLKQKHALNGAELLVNLKLSKQNRAAINLTISQCSLCDYTGSTDAVRRLHYKKKHSAEYSTNVSFDERPVSLIHHQVRTGYTCTLCLKVFSTRPIILEHFLEAHGDELAELSDERFDCDLCPQVLNSFADFAAHQNDHIFKPGRGKFLCNYCGQYKPSKAALQSHIDGHLNLRNFSCDICHKRFNEKRQIMSHMITHSNEKPNACAVNGCTAAFPRLANLREHMLLRHTTEKRYDCEICGKKFMLKQYLR